MKAVTGPGATGGSRGAAAALLALALAVPLLAGCEESSLQRTLGILRQGPDEFRVLPTRPLEIPEGDSLPVPDPDAGSLVADDPLDLARRALDAGSPTAGAPGPAEAALLGRLGAAGPPPGIRALVERERRENEEAETLLVHDLLGVTERRRHASNALPYSEEVERLRELGMLARPAPAEDGS